MTPCVVEGQPYRFSREEWIRAYGPLPRSLLVCHRCDNPRCIRLSHLFVGTPADNSSDMVAKGRQGTPRGDRNGSRTHRHLHQGERHGMAKLTNDQVQAIRVRAASGERYGAIAASVGVSPSTVSMIVARKRWSHVETPAGAFPPPARADTLDDLPGWGPQP